MSKILDEKIKKMTNKERELWALRHTAEHVLHTAMQNLYPQLKKAMGPATEEGFYHDCDPSPPVGGSGQAYKISEADFPKIEKEMQRLIDVNIPMVQEYILPKEAREIFKGNPYKLEWIESIEKRGEKISIYKMANEDLDLCSGPHVESTGKIKAFKLLSIAGAYWHGDEKNKMLTRIYGTCFPTKEELDHYLWQQEEAKKRDHKKLGRELDLFIIPEELGPGLLIWTPKGAVIRREIENFIIGEQVKRGYQHVYSPHIGKKSLWVTSKHWDLYRDKMYSPMKIDEDEYLVKPMNCPMHMLVYKSRQRSYKELPLRIAEDATVYRYEQPGELSGMIRVRYITQDDAHIFCTKDQIVNEFVEVLDYIVFLMKAFKISNYSFRLSLRDPDNKDKYLGDDATWLEAEKTIETAVKRTEIKFEKQAGEAAFYGPKLDVLVKDALGREWQCGTIQIDFMLPERFKLEYIDKRGQIERPALIHRAPLGSLERFVGILIEHYAGCFPVWLSPIQIKLIPIADRHFDYTVKIKQILSGAGIRIEVDARGESMQAKIRDATLQKVPYMGIIGDKEIENPKSLPRQQAGKIQNPNGLYLSVRTREGKDLGLMTLVQFLEKIKFEIEKKL